MSEGTIIGFETEADFDAIGGMYRDWTTTQRPQAGVKDKKRLSRAGLRVIAMTDRTYDSTTDEQLPYFDFDRNRTIFNVQQFGTSLSGYLVLTINGVQYVVECRRENLADIQIPGLRITVLPGLWEFDFGRLTEQQSGDVTVEIETLTSAQQLSVCELFDDSTTPIFTGHAIVRRESWVTVEGVSGPDTVPVTDCLPYLTGNVGRGAIGSAVWNPSAGWVAVAWMCRSFSHANGYVQADDPVLISG